MRILLTNDDGIESAGLRALEDRLSPEHEVWVVAPDGERSGMSHYITLKDPIRCKKRKTRSFSATGSPADCVIVGVLGVLPKKPDIVLSGINIGPNLGTDLIFSGTAAAARQAAYMGIPGVAISLDAFVNPLFFHPVADFVGNNIDLLRDLWDEHHFVNINAPNRPDAGVEVEITRPSKRIYHDMLVNYDSPRGETFYFLEGAPAESAAEDGTDWEAVRRGSIAVSPIYIHPVNHESDDRYRQARFSAGQEANRS